MVLSRLTKITGPGIRTDTNWVGNNANYTGILTASSLGGIGDLTVTGIITASSFSGDGSGLIGVASTDNIVTGTAATFNTYPVDINAGMTVAGVATFAGNVSIAGTLTYEDVTNVDSVGLVTARTGVISPYADIDDFISVGSNIHLGNAGVVTATSFVGSGAALTGIDATSIKDSGGNVKIQAQASGAIHSGVSTFQDIDVDGHTNLDNVSIAGVTTITSSTYPLNVHADTAYQGILVNGNNAPTLGFNTGDNATPSWKIGLSGSNHTQLAISEGTGNTNRFSLSSGGGAHLTGQLVCLNVGIDGNIYNNSDTDTKLQFGTDTINLHTGGSSRISLSNTGVSIPQDLDVDGHTNLDNVSVAGVTTFAGDIRTLNIFPAVGNLDIGSSSNPFRDIHLSNDLSLVDAGLLKLGDNNEFQIQHAGSHNFIEGGSGFSGNLYLRAKLNQEGVIIVSDGAVTLHHSGTAKLVTSSGGIGVTGDITVSGNVDGVDIAALNTTVGTKLANIVEDSSPQLGGELQSNGNNIRLSNQKYIFFDPTGTGIAGYSNGVYFEGNSTGKTIYIRPKLNQDSIKALVDGAVVLHHSGNQKITTESDGVTVTGLMEADRTRNVPITTTQRNALGTPDEGTMIYNSTLKKLQVYTDGQWVSFSGKQINVGGGTISYNGTRTNYVVHTFTSPGTFTTSAALQGVEIMVIGGGGGGGGHRYGSGGGAGGVIMRPASPSYTLNSPAPVVVGAGGNGGPNNGTGGSGSNSTFGSGPTQLVGKGGGGGTSYDGPVYSGRPGGSGGGGTSRATATPGGSATQPGTHGAGTDYGNRGGFYNVPGGGWAPAGGGGAGGSGTDTPTTHSGGGNGAIGVQLSISGSATYYAGGGAGGIYNNQSSPNSYYGVGGNGGGGSSWNSVPGSYVGHSQPGVGAVNSGGGGAGAHGQNAQPLNNSTSAGFSGGSGIVIVAYPTTQPEGEVVA